MSDLNQSHMARLLSWIGAGILLFFIITVITAFKYGLRSIPGPFIAKFTNIWRLVKVVKGDFQQTIIQVHQQYGEVVRIGPDTVSISSPEAIDIIYGLKQNFPKVSSSFTV